MTQSKSWFARLVESGFLPTDDGSLRLKKVALTLLALIIGPLAFFWGSIYILLGHPLSGAIPLSYAIVTGASLVYFFKTKQTQFMEISQLLLVLLLPFLLMWSLGGFAAGSMVMIWAIFSPIAAVIFLDKRIALWWFLAYLVLILVSVLIDERVVAAATPLPELARRVFYFLNVGFGSAGLFLLVSYSLNEEKRSTRADLLVAATAFESQEGMVITDASGIILRVNRAFTAITGYTLDEVVGKVSRFLDSGQQDTAFYNAVWDSVRRTEGWSGEIISKRKNGEIFPQWVTITAVKTDDGAISHYVGTHTDITERKRMEEVLRTSEERYRNFVKDLPIGIVVTQNGLIKYVNQATADMSGYTRSELLEHAFMPLVDEPDRPRVTELHGRRMRGEESESSYVMGVMRKDGVVRQWQVYVSNVEWEGKTSGLGSFVDITERQAAQDEIEQLAFYDPLTHLPNRRLLMDRLQQSLASSARSAGYGALLFLDLDHFKTLNDTLGHDTGDLLLVQVAQRLSNCVRLGDTVARLGGDEFVLLLEGLSEHPEVAATQAENIGEKVLQVLNQPYHLADFEHHSTASIGITLISGHQLPAEELMKQADLAMYQSKSANRNTLRFFDPMMQAVVSERASLEIELREAVKRLQFVLYLQPQVVGEGRVTGAEALVRWLHPQRGMVPPGEFIALAEETGLILPLGLWILEAACTQLAQWASRPDTEHLTLSVNISAKQLHQSDFVEQLLAVLGRTGANPCRLKLELTESLLVSNVEDSIAKMAALKAHGVGFSLDDFGTGFSSLAYLKRLPLDQLKIDQTFVRDILTDPNDAAIAKMVIILAESLGLSVIAEGVEMEAQCSFLARQGCFAYQGYLFSRPLPIEAFEAFIRRA